MNDTPVSKQPLAHRFSERGSTLVFSLLLLTVISLLGLGTMQGAILEEKMAANFRFGTAAHYAAEAGITQAMINHQNNQISTPLSGEIGQSDFSATVTQVAEGYQVISSGNHTPSGSRRTITVVLSGATGTAPDIDYWYADE